MPESQRESAKPPAGRILTGLLRIVSGWERSRHTLDYLLAQEFSKTDYSAEEKARITDRAAGWGRGRGAARFLLDAKLSKPLDSLPPLLRRHLELAVCQLLFDERTPAAVVVFQAVAGIKEKFGSTLGGMANAVLRQIAAGPPAWPDAKSDPAAHLAASFSHPDWIVKRWLERWGWERTRKQLAWDNQRPSIWLRLNGRRGDRSWARQKLQDQGIEFDTNGDFDGYFRLLSPYYPAAAELVESGDFTVQDPSASLAVRLLDPHPGMTILDLCAAPGGKTMLLAQALNDQGRIVAVDSSADRMKRLGEALGRLGIENVIGVVTDGRTFSPASTEFGSFDAVLVDVPCSGLGVLSRRADLRWRRRPEDFPELVALQKALIRAAARCVRSGGVLVYSTCSIEPEENEDIVGEFLSEHDDFALHDCCFGIPDKLCIGPGQIATDSPRDRVDGIDAARLIRRK